MRKVRKPALVGAVRFGAAGLVGAPVALMDAASVGVGDIEGGGVGGCVATGNGVTEGCSGLAMAGEQAARAINNNPINVRYFTLLDSFLGWFFSRRAARVECLASLGLIQDIHRPRSKGSCRSSEIGAIFDPYQVWPLGSQSPLLHFLQELARPQQMQAERPVQAGLEVPGATASASAASASGISRKYRR